MSSNRLISPSLPVIIGVVEIFSMIQTQKSRFNFINRGGSAIN
jgi:hypothetical protein